MAEVSKHFRGEASPIVIARHPSIYPAFAGTVGKGAPPLRGHYEIIYAKLRRNVVLLQGGHDEHSRIFS